MTVQLCATVLAIAVATSAAPVIANPDDPVQAAKSDRLTTPSAASQAPIVYETFELQLEGVSILTRIPTQPGSRTVCATSCVP